jgi:hypothetical protein
MEFDPASFMDDVHAALHPHSPQSRAPGRPRDQQDGGRRELDSVVEDGMQSMFPASKRRRLSTNTESTSPESFDISEWLTAGNEALDIDTPGGSDSESDDDVPAFFSPSESHRHELDLLSFILVHTAVLCADHLRPRHDNSSGLISPQDPTSNPSK